MDLDMITTFISSVGFPIAVAGYMLIKGTKDSAALKDAVNELTTAIKVMSAKDDK